MMYIVYHYVGYDKRKITIHRRLDKVKLDELSYLCKRFPKFEYKEMFYNKSKQLEVEFNIK